MATLLLWLVVALLLVGLLATWALVYQVLRQQGRLVLRLELLEDRLSSGVDVADSELAGVPVGDELPPFRLPDLSGELVSLNDFRGKRLLLVQWSLTCSFCAQVAPELAALQQQLLDRGVRLVLISEGDAEANRQMARQYGLTCPILLQPASQIDAFRGLGTPVAYLVGEDGRVAAPLAIGALDVPQLAQEALNGEQQEQEQQQQQQQAKKLPGQRPVTESRLLRDGLPPGSAAPEFSLPGVNRDSVSLADYRGRKVLLVFSDPDCGPCTELTPKLARLHPRTEEAGLAVVMVSRGDLEENRRKCEEHQVEFPVAVQPGWSVSRQYGIFSTPVAFLIDEDGVIAEKVALGPDAVLALAKTASGRRGAAYERLSSALRL